MLSTDRPGSAHAVKLYDPKRLQVRVDVPLADAGKISVGQRAKVVVAVAPNVTFDGEITRVVPEADIQRNTLQAKVRITNPSAQLRPEMLARVRLEDSGGGATTGPAAASQQVFVPESLVRDRSDGRGYVWVVDSVRSVAEIRHVTRGEARVENWIAIREGLRPGDQLIAGDVSMLHGGHRVKVVGEAEVPPGPPAAEGGSRGAH
jgi:multidrug efflux pump subunit AcrA (membrane-fusion protein)